MPEACIQILDLPNVSKRIREDTPYSYICHLLPSSSVQLTQVVYLLSQLSPFLQNSITCLENPIL